MAVAFSCFFLLKMNFSPHQENNVGGGAFIRRLRFLHSTLWPLATQ
jgi:hypothetical protein